MEKRQTILVVDDNHDLLTLITESLNLLGDFTVETADNGADGLARAVELRPDCVIVDVRMPRMDGYQVVRCIRGDTASAHTPLIILSAMIEEDDQLTGLLSGVDEYLAKPFKPSVLCATLERVMQITPEERTNRIERLALLDMSDLQDELHHQHQRKEAATSTRTAKTREDG